MKNIINENGNLNSNFFFLYDNNPKDIHEFYNILYAFFNKYNMEEDNVRKKIRKTDKGNGHIFSYKQEFKSLTYIPIQTITFKLNKIDTPGDEVIFINIALYRFFYQNNEKKIRKYPNIWKVSIRPGKNSNWNIKEKVIIQKKMVYFNNEGKRHTKNSVYQNRYISEHNNFRLHQHIVNNNIVKILRMYLLSVHNNVPLFYVFFSNQIRQKMSTLTRISNKIFKKNNLTPINIFNVKLKTSIVNKKLMYEILYNEKIKSFFINDFEVLRLLDKSQQDMLLYNIKNYNNIYRFTLPKNEETQSFRTIRDTLRMIAYRYRVRTPMGEYQDFHFKISSYKKLIELHDRLSIEDRLLYVNDVIHIENISSTCFQLEKYLQEKLNIIAQVEMIKNTKRIIEEGVKQRNCVSSYIRAINKGQCTIFSIIYKNKRYTIEIKHDITHNSNKKYKFEIQQFKGFANDSNNTKEDNIIKEEIYDKFRKLISDFNNKTFQGDKKDVSTVCA